MKADHISMVKNIKDFKMILIVNKPCTRKQLENILTIQKEFEDYDIKQAAKKDKYRLRINKKVDPIKIILD